MAKIVNHIFVALIAVESLSHVQLLMTLWTAACQAPSGRAGSWPPGLLLSWPASTLPSPPGPLLPKAAPGSEAPGAPPPPPLCPPLSGSGIPRFRRPGRAASGGQLGREGVREGAVRPLKSAPSYMWEAVAVTQVSRGPWAWRESARAASPLMLC